MPITTAHPITDDDGNEYPHFLVNLAVTPKPAAAGFVDASLACLLTYYRFDDQGEIVRHPDGARKQYIDPKVVTTAAGDPVVAQSLGLIMAAIQGIVTEKGL